MGKAVELSEQLELRFVDRRFRDPGPDEVRVRVEWVGICGSDLWVARTGRRIEYWPAVQGHEVFGRVEALGEDVAHLEPDMAVVADPRFPCGECAQCAVDRDLCTRTTHLGEHCPGGFATHCVLPSANVLPAGDVDGSIAVLTAPLACGLHGIGLLDRPPRRAAILGHGPTGALLHVALRVTFPGIEVVVSESLPARVKLAQAFGAAVGEGPLVDGSFDAVFDTTDDPGSVSRALRLCDDEGRAVVFSPFERKVEIGPSPTAGSQLTMRDKRAFTKELPDGLRMVAEHPHLFRPVVAEAIELSELPDVARREMEAPRGSKVVIRP